ncbi:aspartate racemase [Streptosporangium becharense]|uniref:Aspartate racemase n=1 Tax=Streptosporangium becharense TaxID=1816182 RepID=A0A7W9MK72_9ACTN|nr:amino acid racemase [Streptosporangium becharense]MBB2910575.1 aspartate racemase [Streptosporangium becharense]MBB5823318.1 aspartate racemase [Streptosporangium becharense]
MSRPLLGVLGGMGPLATAHFYRMLVEATPAKTDQEHVRVAIWADPSVPDRTEFLLGEGPSPVPAMLDGLRWLRAAGADCVVIPCNTAHAYVEELVASTGVPVLDMVTAALRSCQAVRPGVRRVGVLATRGTRAARLYERAGSRLGIEVVQVPSAVQREHVDTAIRTVKAGGDLAEAARSIETAARVLHALGAEVGVAACTEIPLVMAGAERVLPMVDSTAGLVEAALARLAVRTGP